MRKILLAVSLTVFFAGNYKISFAQQADTIRKITTRNGSSHIPVVKANLQDSDPSDAGQDSAIKAKLVELAIVNSNPTLRNADDNIKIAQINLIKAQNSWLGSLSAAGNINEFVINNKVVNGVSAASYYPKYNFGVVVPFDIFSKTKNDKKIALQTIDIAKAEKEDKIKGIKKEVLTLYENYKEKKELLRLQKISTEEDNESYTAAQKSYTDGTIQLEEVNRTYQTYISSQSRLVTSQRDYNVAVLELEEEIGVPLDDALSQAFNPG